MVRRTRGHASGFVRWAARLLGTSQRKIEVWERLIITSAAVTLLLHGGQRLHLLDGLETRWHDVMAFADRPQFDVPLTVVAITDADFYNPSLFDGMSPLHPSALTEALRRILEHRPAGLVVDVQIHPPRHESEERSRARLALFRLLEEASAGSPTKIILVRDLQAEMTEPIESESLRTAWSRLTSNRRLVWADPGIDHADGYVRSVRCDVASATPSILGASIATFDLVPRHTPPRPGLEEKGTESDWRIRFTGYFLEDSTAITAHRTDLGALLSVPVVPGQRSLLTGRIVLFGGTYQAGRDLLSTVVGRMDGVYVWAEAIASWIRQDALREPSAPLAFALEFLVGVMAGLLLIRFGPGPGLVYSLLLLGPLTVGFALLAFGNRFLFVNFLPSIVGVYLHYQFEIQHELKSMKRRLEELTSRMVVGGVVTGMGDGAVAAPGGALGAGPDGGAKCTNAGDGAGPDRRGNAAPRRSGAGTSEEMLGPPG
jgi:CHASE2 domain-containing sensor protein